MSFGNINPQNTKGQIIFRKIIKNMVLMINIQILFYQVFRFQVLMIQEPTEFKTNFNYKHFNLRETIYQSSKDQNIKQINFKTLVAQNSKIFNDQGKVKKLHPKKTQRIHSKTKKKSSIINNPQNKQLNSQNNIQRHRNKSLLNLEKNGQKSPKLRPRYSKQTSDEGLNSKRKNLRENMKNIINNNNNNIHKNQSIHLNNITCSEYFDKFQDKLINAKKQIHEHQQRHLQKKYKKQCDTQYSQFNKEFSQHFQRFGHFKKFKKIVEVDGFSQKMEKNNDISDHQSNYIRISDMDQLSDKQKNQTKKQNFGKSKKHKLTIYESYTTKTISEPIIPIDHINNKIIKKQSAQQQSKIKKNQKIYVQTPREYLIKLIKKKQKQIEYIIQVEELCEHRRKHQIQLLKQQQKKEKKSNNKEIDILIKVHLTERNQNKQKLHLLSKTVYKLQQQYLELIQKIQ